MNLAFLHALGMRRHAQATAVAAEVLQRASGPRGGRFIQPADLHFRPGGIQRHDLHRARIHYAMGHGASALRLAGRWSPPAGKPPPGRLVIQAAATLALVVGFGLDRGVSRGWSISPRRSFGCSSCLVGVSLFVLRRREPRTPRPYRAPWYPLVPLLFCLSSLFMVYASVVWAVPTIAPLRSPLVGGYYDRRGGDGLF